MRLCYSVMQICDIVVMSCSSNSVILGNEYMVIIRRGDNSMVNRASLFDHLMEKISNQKVSHSASEVGERRSRDTLTNIPKNVLYSSSNHSLLDIAQEPLGWSGSLSENLEAVSSLIADASSEVSIDLEDKNETEDHDIQCDLECPATEMLYSLSKRKLTLPGISLPPSAASFYNGNSQQLEIVESCESIQRLNLYLKASKDAINAGVPGKFLRAVLGQEASEVGTFISTIMYSFYLTETQKASQFYTVPVINIKRSDLNSHAELKWLLDSCNVDQSSLLFINEVDLSYYDLFGSLKLVLLDVVKLPEKQESLKDSLVEIFNCRKGGLGYSSAGTVNDLQEGSCCALIAEKFASTTPEILAEKGFSRLLLAGILMDTGNLTNTQCTSLDRYMSTLLINGAGAFGCNGLYQILRYKMHDVSDLNVEEILRKDFRMWTRIGKADSGSSGLNSSHVGMSSIGISVAQLLSHDETSTQEIIHFQHLEKLRLLVIVSGYYDTHRNFKREVLISAESADLVKDLLRFFDSHASHLPLKVLHLPGLNDEMRAFKIDKIASRRTMEQLLEEFTGRH